MMVKNGFILSDPAKPHLAYIIGGWNEKETMRSVFVYDLEKA